MSYMVVLVVDDVEQCPAVLDAWEEIGVSGVTILASTGLGRVRKAGLREVGHGVQLNERAGRYMAGAS